MQPAAQPRTRCLSGLGLGISGAALWACLTFGCFLFADGRSWRSLGAVFYAGVMAAYFTGFASCGLGPLGLLIGWQLPRRLVGLRPWSVFWQAVWVGGLAGLLTGAVLVVLHLANQGWDSTDLFFFVWMFSLSPVFGLWAGLWAQRWRERLAHDHVAGRLYYDGACPFCRRWVGRLAFIAKQGGFELLPLQTETACQDLGLAAGVLPHEMKLRLADGRVLGGVDAIIVLAEAAGWTAPLGWLLRGPGVNPLAWRVYRRIAANRYCLGGACVVPPQPGRS